MSIFSPKKRVLLRLLMLLPVLAVGCTGRAEEAVLVAAAANTRYALERISGMFTAATGRSVELVFGSSGRLATQVREQAPFDLFLAADREHTAMLSAADFGLNPPVVYARGRLVFISLHSLKTTDLGRALERVEKLAIANPQQAPYGQAALQALAFYGKTTEDYQMVYGANVTETAHFLLQGAENAFLPGSLLFDPSFCAAFLETAAVNEQYSIAVTEEVCPLLEQEMLLLTEKGRLFYDYLLSEPAQACWAALGYTRGESDE